MQFFIWIVLLANLLASEYTQANQDCVCGQGSDEGLVILKSHGQRIVNGTEVRPHKYPWMAVMMKSWQHICGGSIISDRNILTAGHCVFYIPLPRSTTWIVGTHSIIASKNYMPNSYNTQSYKLHPHFQSGKMFDNFDMAVILVSRPITFSPVIKPICLPDPGDDALYFDQKVTVAGWGRISANGPPSDVLMETHVWLKRQSECLSMTEGIIYDVESMICAHERFTDACQGDSGGPIFTDKENHKIVLGVVSFGDGCARDFPGIYSRVAEKKTLDWIYRSVKSGGGNMCYNPVSERNNF